MRRIHSTLSIIFFFVAILVTAPTPAISQITLQVGGGLGIIRSMGDFNGSTIDYYRGTKYGLSDGINLHGKVRLGLIGFMLVGEVDYASLSNEGNSEPGQGRIEVSQKVLSVKAGPEFQLKIPASPITPYLGVGVAINIFSGETVFQGVSKVPSAAYSVQSTSRAGIAAGGGVLLKLNPSLSLDIAVQYNLMNLLGRAWENVNPLENQRLDSYVALNDDKDPLFISNDDKHFISDQRSINSILFTVTLMFGL